MLTDYALNDMEAATICDKNGFYTKQTNKKITVFLCADMQSP